MKHPSQEILALHAGGDLGWVARWKTARHLADCERCTAEVAAFGELRDALPELSQIPEVPWNRIAGGDAREYTPGVGRRGVRALKRPAPARYPVIHRCARHAGTGQRVGADGDGHDVGRSRAQGGAIERARGAGHGEWNSTAFRRSGIRPDALRRQQGDLYGRCARNLGRALHGSGNGKCNDDESICGIT